MKNNKKKKNSGSKEGKKEPKTIYEGSVIDTYPSGMFKIRLDHGDEILGYISGKIRTQFIRILLGDRVQIEVSRYDSTKGRIIHRLPRNKSWDDSEEWDDSEGWYNSDN